MKEIPLNNIHLAHNSKMVDYAGFRMPLQYTGFLKEHHGVRNRVGLFDVSHMGEFFINGPEAFNFLQYITTNDVAKLDEGKVQYSCFPNATGGIVDDLLVYQLTKQKYMLVVNASNIEKNLTHLKNYNNFDCQIRDASDDYCILAVQGPDAIKLLSKTTRIDLSQIKYYNFEITNIGNVDNVIISNTGYTGAGGFELYIQKEFVEDVFNTVFEAGKEFDILLAGLAARDTLRLEMGFCLYGNELDENTSPIEAGLSWITKFNKDFLNKEMLLAQKERGVGKKLIGFEILEKGIPRKDYLIMDKDDNIIGKVTSGTMSPTLNKPIGMGYINTNFSKIGTEIFVAIRNKKIKAKVIKRPFLK